MTEEEKGIIKHVNIIIKEGLDREDNIQLILEKLLNLIQKQQKEMQKKDKQIDLMAKQLNKLICNIDFDKKLQEGEDYSECIVKYFEKQAKEV